MTFRCNRCHRPMNGSGAYDGACACGGLIENAPADVQIIDGGSVVGFRPTTEAAKEWFDENVHSEDWQWMGPTLYVDHRFADAIATGLVAEGFEVVS